MKNLIYVIVLFFLIIGCDPCPECGEPLVFEPTVEMIFINQDSINSIDDSLRVIAFNDSVLNANIDSLSVLNDSLQVILDSIENGGILQDEKINLEELIAPRKSDSSFYGTLNQDADSLSTVLNSVKSDINSGLMKIDELLIVETGLSIAYTDSMNSWNFPLLFDEASTSYDFNIAEENFSISLIYETFTEVDIQRNVIIRANSIEVSMSSENFTTLDSCNVNCEDGNASFTFYF